MTTGTVLAFLFTGITAPVAIVSGIWLEARMPAPQPPPSGPPTQLRPPGPTAATPHHRQPQPRPGDRLRVPGTGEGFWVCLSGAKPGMILP
jgi:hypothetical protein